MKINVNEGRDFVLEEVYLPVVLRTREGNEYGICMRDDTIEIVFSSDVPEPRFFKKAKPKEHFDEVVDDMWRDISLHMAGKGAILRESIERFGKRFLACEEASHE